MTDVEVSGALTVGTAGGSPGTLTTGILNTSSGSTLTLSSAGIIEVSGSGTLAGSVTDSGRLELKGSPFPGSTNLTFTGTGTVTSGGILDVLAGGQAAFTPSSTWTLAGGSSLRGGTYFVNGTLTILGTIGSSDLDLTINSNGASTAGILSGPGAINNFKEIVWNGGGISLTGGVTDTSGSIFRTAGPDAKTLGCVLALSNGNDELRGPGAITLTSAGKIINIAGNTVPSLTLATSLLYTGAPSTMPSLVNNGTLHLDPSAGPITIGCQYISGSMGNVPSRLEIESGKATSPVTFTGGATFSGTLALNGGTIVLSRGGPSGTMVYTVNGNLETEWSANDLISIATGATLSINSGVSANFHHVSLAGSITGAGQFSIDEDGFHNDDYLIFATGFGPPPSMSGTGRTVIGGNGGNGSTMTVNKSVSLGGRTLESRGVINVTSGNTLTLSGGNLKNNGQFTVASGGTLAMTGGTLHNEAHGTFTANGAVTVAGGATVDNEGTFTVAGSLAPGSGSNGQEAFTNHGSLTLNAGATLSIGSYTQDSSGTLVVHLASSSPGGKGLLSVARLASLAGALNVVLDNGYQPAPNSSFAIVTFGSRSGQFTTTSLPSGMVVNYNTNNVTVTQT